MSDNKPKNEMPELEELRAKHPYKGTHFKNLKTHPVHLRPLRGTSGAWFDLSDNKTIEAHISEIPVRGQSQKHRHMLEAIIYIVSGRGHSMIHKELGDRPTRVDWAEGDMFSPPLNWWHQHFNDDSGQPARYLAITNLGFMKTMGMATKEQAPEGAPLPAPARRRTPAKRTSKNGRGKRGVKRTARAVKRTLKRATKRSR